MTLGKTSSKTRLSNADAQPAWITVMVCLTLAVCVLVVYIPAYQAGFMKSWDDSAYLHNNLPLQAPDGLHRIWTTAQMPESYPNYPLTFTTFWIELKLWGLNPTGFHVTNVVLHALNVVLLFFVLRSLTTPYWVAAVVAMLFALHPVQVESVAWITERKNVLSTGFYFLSFLFYRRFRARKAWGSYTACLLLFLCALLSKTATVTLVASLFLADWWIDKRSPLRSLVALLPLIALGLVFALITSTAEHEGLSDPVAPLLRPFLVARTFWFYVSTLFWPHPLLAVYPKWSGLLQSKSFLAFAIPPVHFWLAVGAFLVTGGVIALLANRLPALILWGLGHWFFTLLPMLGLVQFGYQSHSFVADRFVYLAGFGLFLSTILVLRSTLCRLLPNPSADGPTSRRSARTVVGATLALCLVAGLGVSSWKQAALWTSSLTLWSHTVQYNDESHEAHDAVGVALSAHKRYDKALRHYLRAVELVPDNVKYLTNLGNAYQRKGQFKKAIGYYRRAIARNPRYAKAYYNLANVYIILNQMDPAIAHLQQAIRHDPHYTKAYQNLAIAYTQKKDLTRLAWLLATCPQAAVRNGNRALWIARQLVETKPREPLFLTVLAASQAEVGQFDQAVETAQAAQRQLANPEDPLANRLNAMVQRFRKRQPFRSGIW